MPYSLKMAWDDEHPPQCCGSSFCVIVLSINWPVAHYSSEIMGYGRYRGQIRCVCLLESLTFSEYQKSVLLQNPWASNGNKAFFSFELLPPIIAKLSFGETLSKKMLSWVGSSQ